MTVADSGRSRLASIPADESTDRTALMRRHSQCADFGHALSRSMPSLSATGLSLLCNPDEIPTNSLRHPRTL